VIGLLPNTSILAAQLKNQQLSDVAGQLSGQQSDTWPQARDRQLAAGVAIRLSFHIHLFVTHLLAFLLDFFAMSDCQDRDAVRTNRRR